MRSTSMLVSLLAVIACAMVGAWQQDRPVKVRLRLVDAETGQPLAGLVRVSRDGQPLPLPGLYDRLKGLEKTKDNAGWHVAPIQGGETSLPRAVLRLEALSGLETALERQDIDPAKTADITIKLRPLFRPEKLGLAAGNTHLHLRKLTLEDAKEYLRQIPAADGIKVMFISYLERFQDDADYITNRIPVGDLPEFDQTGVLFNNGEEHRHNFEAFGQGYGHVMLLRIKELVKPVSLGPGITGRGFDDSPLHPGIDNARQQGGTIIWCHNTNGHEDVPNALAGRLDALNVFDGSRSGTFDHTYYRYLNIGLRMPISTGTDWFMYDFARVYAKTPRPVTIAGWLAAVKAGRCSVTNGPLLTLSVDGQAPGGVIALDQPRPVKVVASAIGRHDFQSLQLVHNGKVVQTAASRERPRPEPGYAARLETEVRLDGPAWLAVRIETQTRNEFGAVLFAHTSPVYVDVAGQGVFDVEAARALQKMLEEAQADIQAKGKFSTLQARHELLAVYTQAAKELARRVEQRKK